MKLVKNLTFWGLFLVLLCILSVVVSPKNNTTQAGVVGRDHQAEGIFSEKENTIDVVFLGDSECLTSVSPMELWEKYGMTSYVCGQTGQRVVESYYWLRDIFEEQSPKAVVLETNLLYRYEGIYKELDYGIGETAEYYVPFFRYHNRWKNLSKKDLSLDFEDSARNVMKGFECKNDVVPYTGGAYMTETDKEDEIKWIVRYYLDKIRELCEENGASFLLFGVPSPANWSMPKHNGVDRYARERELLYLDLNLKTEEPGINWETDSHDGGDHLNYSGAMKVTDDIGSYLVSNYELKDHRGESGYELWEDEQEEYQKRILECGKE